MMSSVVTSDRGCYIRKCDFNTLDGHVVAGDCQNIRKLTDNRKKVVCYMVPQEYKLRRIPPSQSNDSLRDLLS